MSGAPRRDPDPPPPLVLASRSPRRAALLRSLGLDFEQIPADHPEEWRSGESPGAHVERLAREKAAAVAAGRGDALVVGGDTIVVLDGEILGKPSGADEAVEMLLALEGREHVVVSGVAVRGPGRRSASGRVRTEVSFRSFERSWARAYVETGEPMDKAGGYGIQGFGAALVGGLRGDYYAVMGLPVALFLELAEEVGWRYAFGRFEPAPGR